MRAKIATTSCTLPSLPPVSSSPSSLLSWRCCSSYPNILQQPPALLLFGLHSRPPLHVSRLINVNVDSPNLGFPYFNCLGEVQCKKTPCITIAHLSRQFCKCFQRYQNNITVFEMDVVRQTFDRFCLLGWMRVQMHQRWGKTDAESWCKMRVCNSTILQFYSSTILQFCICTETNASQFLIFAADQSGLPRWWWGCRWEQVFRFRLGGCQCCQHFHDMCIISPPWWSSGKNLWKEMMYEKHKIQQITPWHHEVVSFCSKYLNWLQLKGED